MMLEAITVFSCLNNTGCAEASSSYYNSHPSFKEQLDSIEQNTRQLAGSYVVEYAVPLLGTIAGREVYFKLNRDLSLKLHKDNNKLVYTKEW